MALDERYPLALSEGTILAGQYIIEKILGQGGFGITYCATDHKTGQRVAVKEFFPDALAYRDGTTVISYPGERTENYDYGKENFLQEAQTLAQFIGNENIVRIHSYFEENETAYFVMDYIEGISFDEYLKEKGGRISVEETEKILIPIMDALDAVHSKGIVHRDVTPDNIYICNDGTVKLLDFGAARYSLGDKSRSLDVILKHGFAPKEQYTRRGKQGPYTDIYSLAATFYFAITGKRPPDSVDRLDEDDLIPPSTLGIEITDYQEKALYQALAVQPYERFQSMAVFKKVLLNEKKNSEQKTVPDIETSVHEPDASQRNFSDTPSQSDVPAIQSEAPETNIPAPAVPAEKPTRSRSKNLLIGIVAAAALVVIGLAVINAINTKPNSLPISASIPETESSRSGTDNEKSSRSSGDFSMPSSEPEQSWTESSYTPSTSGNPVSIYAGVSKNLVNDGLVAWDGYNQFFIDNNYHDVCYFDSDGKLNYLYQNQEKKFFNLYCYDGLLYFIYDGSVYYVDYKNGTQSYPVSTLDAYQGKIDSLYVTDDYYFIHYTITSSSGYVYRITRSTGKTEDSISVDYANTFIMVDDWLYYITKDNSGRSGIMRVAANDFSTYGEKLVYLNSGNYEYITSDGSYVYGVFRNNSGSWTVERYNADITITGEHWNLSSIMTDLNSTIGAVNVFNDSLFVTMGTSSNKTLYRLRLYAGNSGKYEKTSLSSGNTIRPSANIIPFDDGSYDVCFMGEDLKLSYVSYDSDGNLAS